MAYSFKICSVSSAMNLEGFYQFVRRMVNQYEGYQISLCYTAKDCSVLVQFGPHFDLKTKPEEARGFNGYINTALSRISPDHEIKTTIIEDDRLLLDETTWMSVLSRNRKLIIELHCVNRSTAQVASGYIIPLYEDIFIDEHGKLVIDLKYSREVSVENGKLVVDLTSKEEKRSQFERDPNHVLHGVPGEANCELDKVRMRWLSGEYHTRDLCAGASSGFLGISFAAARLTLRDMPEPYR